MSEYKCGDCFYADLCEKSGMLLGFSRDNPAYCSVFLNSADVAPVQKWISVKDRSPEAGGYVVCIAKRNPFSRFMPMVAKIEKNGWVNPITEQYISDVSHWMPIPEPPKEEW